MTSRRTLVTVAATGAVPLALGALTAAPAAAHGTLGDPVSRVAACYAEGPESPDSAACKAAVAAGGTQALYDWNGIRIGDAAGRHQARIADGELCSAGDPAFKGMDLARADWPSTTVEAGAYTFRYRVTAPHKGTFTLYLTKPGYDPAKPLKWSDLDLANPVATKTDPAASGGYYTFSGNLPERSGKHLVYGIWQRSDSPEAFYSCSDVAFGGANGGGGGASRAPVAEEPTDEQIADGADESTVDHPGPTLGTGGHGDGHGDDHASPTATKPAAGSEASAAPEAPESSEAPATSKAPAATDDADATAPNGSASPLPGTENLAATGGDGATPMIAAGGAAAVAVGSGLFFAALRRKAATGRRAG
ncbi:lytic polysaccharide monooxygenase [Streptomyces sp. NPDC060194]|uniref:lytic polysaccharide monooxygenase auxiliary activity family 9 protein n=1 Tax=Streptomyces sp. NPDC060194 TaxID=3347069 RepID=UPI0036474DE9